jgi:hypothetical protein
MKRPTCNEGLSGLDTDSDRHLSNRDNILLDVFDSIITRRGIHIIPHSPDDALILTTGAAIQI